MAFYATSSFHLCDIMKQRQVIAISAFVTAIIIIIFYHPLSLVIYKIREPYFKCPIKIESKSIIIRNDLLGEGDFGAKRRNGRLHSGVDILAPVGTPVYASKSGIAFCGNIPTGYGKYVMIYHPDNTQTMYGHLSAYNVISTKKVRQGDIIGFVGKTGNASYKSIQPHLHFEIKKEGQPQDPRGLMR